MAKTRRNRYWQASERDYRCASNREANILKDIDRYARDLRFIRTPPRTAAALLQEFRQNRKPISGRNYSYLRHDYTNYDKIADRIARKNGVCKTSVPRNKLHGVCGQIIKDYLNSIGWTHGDLSPMSDARRVCS
jgi:hypothetical protein